MSMPIIRHVRAFTLRGAGADYHDQAAGHWIDDHIATPTARYPEYRASRQSFGLNVLGTHATWRSSPTCASAAAATSG